MGPVSPPVLGDREATAVQIVKIVEQSRERARQARMPRRALNRRNWDFYHGKQDWSHKIEGQSKEFLPDLPIQLEQIASTLEQQLTASSDWFQIEGLGGEDILDAQTAQKLLAHVLGNLSQPGDVPDGSYPIQTLLADALKMGLIESAIVLKVYGVDHERPVHRLEWEQQQMPSPGGMVGPTGTPIFYERAVRVVQTAFVQSFRLAIDLIPYEDHYPDPGPHCLYDIHEVTKHISELRSNPGYEPYAIEKLAGRAASEEEWDKRRREGHDQPTEDPQSVRVMEFWGDLVDPDTGETLIDPDTGEPWTNVLTTVCMGEVLRWPVKNPMWHQRRPFVKAPLIRTPKATTHKAFMDHAVPMAEAENEIFSLMLDGGIAAVWGTRQLREDVLQDPDEVAKGVPPGFTARLKRGIPPGVKFLERVDDYVAPQYADLMLQRAGQARQTGMLANDIAIGQMPERQVKATELVIADKAASSLLGSLSSRIEETIIEPMLELAWPTILQHLEDFTAPELVAVLGVERAALLSQLQPAERFVLYTSGVTFKARGLRNIQARAENFNKLMLMLNFVMSNPAMAIAYDQIYSIKRTMDEAFKLLNLDPTRLERRADEMPILNPAMVMQPGQGGPQGMPPQLSSEQEAMAPPNMNGDRGLQS